MEVWDGEKRSEEVNKSKRGVSQGSRILIFMNQRVGLTQLPIHDF